ncbi:MAG: hypothetical protein VX546_15560 [Myxococcota bacterium]|nr:hypothetical protein [Myxococcota bacterium]
MSDSPDETRLRRRMEQALERNDPLELERLVVEIALESEDRVWSECTCAQLARHRSAGVRGGALLGFGHLARRFGALDRRRVHRLVEIGLHAHNELVRDQAASAADDLETFLAWRFERPA